MNDLKLICQTHTKLNEEEIAFLEHISLVLQPLADLEQADVFIDCACKNDPLLAVVVAGIINHSGKSSYTQNVVGDVVRQENEPAVIRTLNLGFGTRHVKAVVTMNSHAVQSVEAIRFHNKIIGVLIIEKKDDKVVLENEIDVSQMLEGVADTSEWLTKYIDEAVLMVDSSGNVCFRNNLARELYKKIGYVHDILGMQYKNVMLHRIEADASAAEVEVVAGNHILKIKQIILNAHGVSFSLIIRDVTNIREKEKELILKSVAMKEMHHRIKNNLQTILSLLRMRCRRSNDEEVKAILNDVMDHIMSISLTHEFLLENGIEQCFEVRSIIQHITSITIGYFCEMNKNIILNVTGGDFTVDSDTANSICLVVSELLQNIYKYAFVNRNEGQVKIEVTRGNLQSEVVVQDNGVGFSPDEIDNNSLGFCIITAIVKDKLGGTVDIESNDSGSKIAFSFINK